MKPFEAQIGDFVIHATLRGVKPKLVIGSGIKGEFMFAFHNHLYDPKSYRFCTEEEIQNFKDRLNEFTEERIKAAEKAENKINSIGLQYFHEAQAGCERPAGYPPCRRNDSPEARYVEYLKLKDEFEFSDKPTEGN